ncbi:MAG: uroporphyrinogen decarboxylase [Cryobacterium sp.]|nr:uroporphyrinogen decarboxylase [Oligoflexia bacterium]
MKIGNPRFQAALRGEPQATPPVWFMRQAGRYHAHYQALRKKHSFMELCKDPRLAAAVALGPIEDFDFDVSIFFSDLLFPLEAMGMGLTYSDSQGPQLGWHLTGESVHRLRPVDEAIEGLQFQREALSATRRMLPPDKSLIGFVGSPWTLFTYAVQGRHAGSLQEVKSHLGLFPAFCEKVIPLLLRNIELQFEGGAEIVMLFDTAAGEISPWLYREKILPEIEKLARSFPGKLGYYSKGTQSAYFVDPIWREGVFAGQGVDHRWDLSEVLRNRAPRSGFVQGNFDEALLFSEPNDFRARVESYLAPLIKLSTEERAGWVCGLGHGVLPKTPEQNVREFVQIIRRTFR